MAEAWLGQRRGGEWKAARSGPGGDVLGMQEVMGHDHP